jgi:His/Glu/Gln/Arg/opine family amino acid ABC transporter permease subunit
MLLKLSVLLDLLRGASVTVGVSSLAVVAGIPLGLILAIGRTGTNPIVRIVCGLYASFVRAVPVVTFVMFIYFGLPALGFSLNPFPAAILALALNTASFNCEIWRAAIMDVPPGQIEAARASGMTRWLIFRRVVFPEIWRASLPALVNEITLLIKVSPAIAVIGVVDLVRKAREIAETTFQPIPPFSAALLIYGLVLAVLVVAARMLERHIRERVGRI